MHKRKGVAKGGLGSDNMGLKGQQVEIQKLMKDIEHLGASRMTWKERKELENKKVVSLGGKPPKKQRLPLSVARFAMKKQKEREQKQLQEGLVLGHFGVKLSGSSKRREDKRKPEDRMLKCTEGHFRNGVLDVKHMLRPTSSAKDGQAHVPEKRKKKGKGKKSRGKRKGSKRH